MQITGTADINKAFKSMASDIKELINTRDTAYKEIDRINADNDLSGEGKLHKASAVHEAYAESKKTVLIRLLTALDDLDAWDSNRTEVTITTKFTDALQLAKGLIGDISAPMMNTLAKSCADRLQLDCICRILRANIGVGASNATKHALETLESKVYDPIALYSKAKADVYDCLKDNDFLLHRLTTVIANVCSKINVSNTDEADKAFDVEAPLTDLQNEIESGIGVAKSGSSPIKMIYVNGKLVDGDLNLTTNSDLSRI